MPQVSQNQPFKEPSKKWGFLLSWLRGLSLISCVFLGIEYFRIIPTVWLKVELIASMFTLFGSNYLLTGYRYLMWVTPLKNTLYTMQLEGEEIIYFKFNRYFINEKVPLSSQFDPSILKEIKQYDLREICRLVEVSTRKGSSNAI